MMSYIATYLGGTMKLNKGILKYYSKKLRILFICDVVNKREVYLSGNDARKLDAILRGKKVRNFDLSELVNSGFICDE